VKTVLVDASSAILLFKADLFDILLQAYRVVMVSTVFQEVTVSGLPGFAYFCRKQENGQLHVIQVDTSGLPAAMKGLIRLGPGERDTIYAFASGRADFILLDDRKGAQYCRSNKIPHANALLCPKLLFFSGLLDAQRCKGAFKALLKIGYYSKDVICYACSCTGNELTDFLSEVETGPMGLN
jgi:predicted nucleic acid-binding protein